MLQETAWALARPLASGASGAARVAAALDRVWQPGQRPAGERGHAVGPRRSDELGPASRRWRPGSGAHRHGELLQKTSRPGAGCFCCRPLGEGHVEGRTRRRPGLGASRAGDDDRRHPGERELRAASRSTEPSDERAAPEASRRRGTASGKTARERRGSRSRGEPTGGCREPARPDPLGGAEDPRTGRSSARSPRTGRPCIR